MISINDIISKFKSIDNKIIKYSIIGGISFILIGSLVGIGVGIGVGETPDKSPLFDSTGQEGKLYKYTGDKVTVIDNSTSKLLYKASSTTNQRALLPNSIMVGYTSEEIKANYMRKNNEVQDLNGVGTESASDYLNGIDSTKAYAFSGSFNNQKPIDVTHLILEKYKRSTTFMLPSGITEIGFTAKQIKNAGYVRMVGTQDLDGVSTNQETSQGDNPDLYILNSESIAKSTLSSNEAYTFIGDEKTKNNITKNLLYFSANNARPSNIPSSISRGYTASEIADTYLRPTATITDLNGVTTNISTRPPVNTSGYRLRSESHLKTESYLKTESILKSDLDSTKVYVFTGTAEETKTPEIVTSNLLYIADANNQKPTNVPSGVTTRGYTKEQIEGAGYYLNTGSTGLNGVTVSALPTTYVSKATGIFKEPLSDREAYVRPGNDNKLFLISKHLLYITDVNNQKPTNVPSNVTTRGYTKQQIEGAGYLLNTGKTALNGVTTPTFDVDTTRFFPKSRVAFQFAYTLPIINNRMTNIGNQLLYKAKPYDPQNPNADLRPDNVPDDFVRGYPKEEIEEGGRTGGVILRADKNGLPGINVPNQLPDYWSKDISFPKNERHLRYYQKTTVGDRTSAKRLKENRYPLRGFRDSATLANIGPQTFNELQPIVGAREPVIDLDKKLEFFQSYKLFDSSFSRDTANYTPVSFMTYANLFLPDFAQLTQEDITTILGGSRNLSNIQTSKYGFRLWVGDRRTEHFNSRIGASSWDSRTLGSTAFNADTFIGDEPILGQDYSFTIRFIVQRNANTNVEEGFFVLQDNHGGEKNKYGAFRGIQIYKI